MVDENGDPLTTGPQRGGSKSGRSGSQGEQNFFGSAAEKSGIKMSNYPNPANPATTIHYAIEQPAPVSLSIYNVTGQMVRHFDFGYRSAGEYTFRWDASNEIGISVPSGIYFYRIQADERAVTRRLLLVR